MNTNFYEHPLYGLQDHKVQKFINKIFSIHSRAEIFSLSNFLKICFCIFTCASSYCDRKLSWVYAKKISKEKILIFAL